MSSAAATLPKQLGSDPLHRQVRLTARFILIGIYTEHLRKAAEAITGKTESVSVVVSVVGDANARPNRH